MGACGDSVARVYTGISRASVELIDFESVDHPGRKATGQDQNEQHPPHGANVSYARDLSTGYLVTCLALGCAAGDPPEPDAVLGTLDQPIYVSNTYGQDGQLPCTVPTWESGKCEVPKHKTQTLDLNTNSFPADWDNAVIWAAEAMQGWAEDCGVNIVIGYNQGGLGWSIGYINSAVGAPGTTLVDTTPPPFGGYSCNDYDAGDLCQYVDGWVEVRGPKLTNGSNYIGANAAGKLALKQNLVMHEIGHIIGFGHDCTGSSCSTLMTAALNTNHRIVRLPTADQCWRLCRYNPTGNSPLPGCPEP